MMDVRVFQYRSYVSVITDILSMACLFLPEGIPAYPKTEQWHRKWRTRQTETYLSQHTYCRGYTQIWGQSGKQMKKLREPEYRRPLTHGPWEYCSMPLASDRHPCGVHRRGVLLPPSPCLTPLADDFLNKTWMG